ncbi:MAG: hypothetical protein OXL37_15345 [Chloroflexota bacterium]|nr:hypothetical protein [Chloroflexota bacterium]MDE2959414.1 hypothetical protein [Chloroflexota bacterium]
MSPLKKLVCVYMLGTAVAVAVFFIVSTFLGNVVSALVVWHVLDVLMLIGLATALAFNIHHKVHVSVPDGNQAVTRAYLEANATFYLTLGVSLVFLYNWFRFLNGSEGDVTNDIIWIIVDTMAPTALGVTGCRLWRESSRA